MFITTHYRQHEILMSFEDWEIRELHKWRVYISRSGNPYALASAPRSEGDPRRKRNIYLGRLIADRMGLPAGAVGYINGNPLDNRRENLRIVKRPHRPHDPAWHPIQNPPGLHRHALGAQRPAAEYSLCAFPGGPRAPEHEYRIAAIARRSQSPTGALWSLRLINTRDWLPPVPFHDLHTLIAAPHGADSISTQEMDSIK